MDGQLTSGWSSISRPSWSCTHLSQLQLITSHYQFKLILLIDQEGAHNHRSSKFCMLKGSHTCPYAWKGATSSQLYCQNVWSPCVCVQFQWVVDLNMGLQDHLADGYTGHWIGFDSSFRNSILGSHSGLHWFSLVWRKLILEFLLGSRQLKISRSSLVNQLNFLLLSSFFYLWRSTLHPQK